jgi:hypothetical protein
VQINAPLNAKDMVEPGRILRQIDYALVSTYRQILDVQREQLPANRCTCIDQEKVEARR